MKIYNTKDNEEPMGNNGLDPIRSRVDQELVKDLKKLQVPRVKIKYEGEAIEDQLEEMEKYVSMNLNISSKPQTAWAIVNFSRLALQWWSSYKAKKIFMQ